MSAKAQESISGVNWEKVPFGHPLSDHYATCVLHVLLPRWLGIDVRPLPTKRFPDTVCLRRPVRLRERALLVPVVRRSAFVVFALSQKKAVRSSRAPCSSPVVGALARHRQIL
jgi:hypothetical protein